MGGIAGIRGMPTAGGTGAGGGGAGGGTVVGVSVVAGGVLPVVGGGGGACCVGVAGWPVSGVWVADAGGGEAGAEEAGVVLTPGVGAGLLSETPIANAMPTSSTATAVPMTTTPGRRYQGMTGSFFSRRGLAAGSKFSAGRADV